MEMNEECERENEGSRWKEREKIDTMTARFSSSRCTATTGNRGWNLMAICAPRADGSRGVMSQPTGCSTWCTCVWLVVRGVSDGQCTVSGGALGGSVGEELGGVVGKPVGEAHVESHGELL